MATLIDDKTQNFSLPLPHPENLMPTDCNRIRQAIIGLDSQVEAVKEKANAALPKAGGEMTGHLIQRMAAPRISQKLIGTSKDSAPTVRVSGGYSVYTDDAEPNQIGGMGVEYNTDQVRTAFIQAVSADATTGSRITAVVGLDGTGYAICYHPRANNYGNDIVTMRTMKDYAQKKTGSTSILWVNEETGSDTANLMEGRGFSQDMPFASLPAAVAWVTLHMSGSAVTINLDSDINLPSGLNVGCPSLGALIISADTHTINLGAPISVSYGKLNLKRGKWVATSPMRCFMYAAGLAGYNPILSLEHTLELQGTVTEATILAAYGGTVIMYTGSELIGTVIGKRYSALNGGRILVGGRGGEAIPGTQPGTCDASSIYA